MSFNDDWNPANSDITYNFVHEWGSSVVYPSITLVYSGGQRIDLNTGIGGMGWWNSNNSFVVIRSMADPEMNSRVPNNSRFLGIDVKLTPGGTPWGTPAGIWDDASIFRNEWGGHNRRGAAYRQTHFSCWWPASPQQRSTLVGL